MLPSPSVRSLRASLVLTFHAFLLPTPKVLPRCWQCREVGCRGILVQDRGINIVGADASYLATVWALPVIIAITFHEAAHGFVAHLLGDDTAWRLGRVSFNPLRHVDPFGTILLPGMLLLRSP